MSAFYKQVKSSGGIDIHVIYNFASHRVDADLSFGENCDGLRDDYIESIVKQAAEHAVTCINEYPALALKVREMEAALREADNLVDAWGESWDCSSDPGHDKMHAAITEYLSARAALGGKGNE